jgi:hypothetical protein
MTLKLEGLPPEIAAALNRAQPQQQVMLQLMSNELLVSWIAALMTATYPKPEVAVAKAIDLLGEAIAQMKNGELDRSVAKATERLTTGL